MSDSKLKLGRPPLAPRLDILERQVSELREAMEALMQANESLGNIVQILQDSVSRGTTPNAEGGMTHYKPAFDRWPVLK